MYSEKIRNIENILENISKKEKFEFSEISLEDFEKYKITRIDKGKWMMDDGRIISESMRKAIALTYYRRNLQRTYNEKNTITPTTIFSSIKDM